MYIYKLDRYWIERRVKELGSYIKGRTLDLGAGNYNRYGNLFDCGEYLKMDVEGSSNIDVVGDATNIPFPQDSFDSIVSTQVFEHVIDPDKAASEVYRVLRSGGHFLITVPQTNELHSEPYDYWRFTRFGIAELFGRHKFKLRETRQFGGYFSTLAHLSMRYLIDRFSLHSHRVVGAFFSNIFYVIGRLAVLLDSIDASVANKKHTLGWCMVFEK